MMPFQAMRLRNSGAAPVVSSLWNSADKGASVVLSNGDLTATKAGSGYQSVRGVNGKSSGARYFELLVVNSGSSGTFLMGVADATFTLTGRYLGEANAGAKKSAGRTTATTFYRNLTNAAGNGPTSGAAGTGSVVGIGMDFSTFTMTIYNGLTGALLATYVDASPWGTMFPAVTLQNGGIVTLSAAGPFAFLPSGFVAWDSP